MSRTCGRVGRTYRCYGKVATFKEALSFSVLLNGIRETREVPHVPNHHFVCGVVSMSEMLMIQATPFDENRHVFAVLFADETLRKHVSLSGPIPLSISGKNQKVGIVITV